MPDIIKPPQTYKESMSLTASEVREASWLDLDGGKQRILPVEDLDQDTVLLVKDALSHHGLYSEQKKIEGEMFLVVDMTSKRHQLAFDALHTNPDDFTGGIIGYGIGPDPKMVDLDVHNAAFAQRALKDANLNNQDTGQIEHGITREQANTLLEWSVQRARNHFFKDGNRSKTNASTMSGACGLMQGLIGHQTEMMGITTYYHQARDQSENSIMAHAFSVVDIPIEDNGHVQSQMFLVDASFRQFFEDNIVQYASNGHVPLITPSWGSRLVETPEGKDLADSLLADGYAPITQDTARLYVQAQTFDKHPVTQDFHYGEWKTNSPLRALKQDTTENDYDMEEFVEWGADIRTPQMVLDDMPLSVILEAANDDNSDAPTASGALDF